MTTTDEPATITEDPTAGVEAYPTAETFEAFTAAGNRACVLFTARWCVAGAILLRQLDENPPGIPVVAVDVDAFPHLADRFHVHSLPTAVLLCAGERGRLLGAFGAAQVKALVARGLATDTAEVDDQPKRRKR